MYTFAIARSADNQSLDVVGKMANRHGLIAGATGTGKTVSLRRMAEAFSEQGIPVFLVDVKGDLSGLVNAGANSGKVAERMQQFGLPENYLQGFPVRFWDVFGDTGIGASLAWKNGYDARTENAISYYTPTISGFRAGINYGFGEQVKARDSRYVGVGLAYDNGPISVGFGYDRQNNVAATAAAALFTSKTAQDLSTWQLGGSYNFGVAKAAALYKETKYEDIPGSDAPTAKLKTFGLGVTAPVGAGEVRASYNHHRLTGLGDTLKADQFSLGYVHNLSKRTALYGTYAYIKNKENNGYNMTMELNGAMAGAGLKDSGAQHGFQVGVRHAF